MGIQAFDFGNASQGPYDFATWNVVREQQINNHLGSY